MKILKLAVTIMKKIKKTTDINKQGNSGYNNIGNIRDM